jgi:hypothetical protein
MPELGIYAMLPSNRHVPHRVRMLMDFLAKRRILASSSTTITVGVAVDI